MATLNRPRKFARMLSALSASAGKSQLFFRSAGWSRSDHPLPTWHPSVRSASNTNCMVCGAMTVNSNQLLRGLRHAIA